MPEAPSGLLAVVRAVQGRQVSTYLAALAVAAARFHPYPKLALLPGQRST
jgi:hypothetical protein